MVPIVDVDLDIDLTEFTQFLWLHNIPHRVIELDSIQRLCIPRHVSQDRVQELFQFWQSGGDLNTIQVVANHSSTPTPFSVNNIKRIPITVILVVCSALLTLLIDFGSQAHWLVRFTFTDIVMSTDNMRYQTFESTLSEGQFWRLLTPIFLHFSVIHILFNALWVWMVGGLIERTQGSMHYLSLVFYSGVISNMAQFWVSGPLFGGLSGVVFAIISYTWLWDKMSPRPMFGLPPALFGLALFWLVLGYSGALEFAGFGSIANTAHLSGLLSGLSFALISRVLRSSVS